MRTKAVILAGGASRRMGVDKLALPYSPKDATTVLHHVVNVCTSVADEVWVSVGVKASANQERVHPAPPYQDLARPAPARDTMVAQPTRAGGCSGSSGAKVCYVPDAAPFEGPLSALCRVWTQVSCQNFQANPNDCADTVVFVIAADLVGLHPQVLLQCREVLVKAGDSVDAAIVTREGRWQPLLGCYRLGAGRAFEAARAAGGERLMPALERLSIVTIAAEDQGFPVWWTKPLHTPEDYRDWFNQFEGGSCQW